MANSPVQCSPKDIANNTCKLDINKAICIKGGCKDWYDAKAANSPDILIQDMFLTATMLIGTVVTLVLIVSGIKYIIAWADNSWQAASAKKWIKSGIIGLIIVTFSYTIVRLIQYIAAWYW